MTNTDRATALALLGASAALGGIFVDFDGTLAPIVSDPSSAAPLPGAKEALFGLASRFSSVAVISGRPVSFLAAHFGPLEKGGLQLFGLHGLEELEGSRTVPAAGVDAYAGAVALARASAVKTALKEVVVEDKVYGLTLHWRNATDKERAGNEATSLGEQLAEANGLSIRRGKASVELYPPVGIDKGTVTRRLGGGLRTVAFIGDDISDIHGFDALDELARAGATTLRIAVDSKEIPPELESRADLVLSGPKDAVGFLSQLDDLSSRSEGS